jgi:hypothetical protein
VFQPSGAAERASPADLQEHGCILLIIARPLASPVAWALSLELGWVTSFGLGSDGACSHASAEHNAEKSIAPY